MKKLSLFVLLFFASLSMLANANNLPKFGNGKIIKRTLKENSRQKIIHPKNLVYYPKKGLNCPRVSFQLNTWEISVEDNTRECDTNPFMTWIERCTTTGFEIWKIIREEVDGECIIVDFSFYQSWEDMICEVIQECPEPE